MRVDLARRPVTIGSAAESGGALQAGHPLQPGQSGFVQVEAGALIDAGQARMGSLPVIGREGQAGIVIVTGRRGSQKDTSKPPKPAKAPKSALPPGPVPEGKPIEMTQGERVAVGRGGSLEYNASIFGQQTFTNRGFEGMLETSITHPAGISYFRVVSTVPPGRNWAIFRQDVEGINVGERVAELGRILGRIAPSDIHWENLFLLWNALLPDGNVNIGRIRQLAIDLQDMDQNGQWDYATLRQRVHNFPEPSLVDDVEREAQRARDELERVPPGAANNDLSRTMQRRVALLQELGELERLFWRGSGLDNLEIANRLQSFGITEGLGPLLPAEGDALLVRIRKLTEIRKMLRERVGSQRGRSVADLMASTAPLVEDEADVLVTCLDFDRRASNEISRLMAHVDMLSLGSDLKSVIVLMSDILFLEGLISKQRAEEIVALTSDIRANLASIRRLFSQASGDIQGRFAFMQEQIGKFYDGQNREMQGIGDPGRLAFLSDNEIRQSPLFGISAVIQAVGRSLQSEFKVEFAGKSFDGRRELDLVYPLSRPVEGEVVVIRTEKDVERVTRMAQSGVHLVLVKLEHNDIELPPVDMLVTADVALNEASHMSLLARNRGIPHINFYRGTKDSTLLDYLVSQEGKEVLFRKGEGGGVVVEVIDQAAEVAHGAEAKMHLPREIDDTFDKPVRLEDLPGVEKTRGKKISGGKGRGLASLLAGTRTEASAREALAIPASVQLPYGFFMRWLEMVDLKGEWEKAVRASAISSAWEILERLSKHSIPPALMKEIITAMGGKDAVSEGWYVRSNANSEDGGFNAAGVNLTLPDIRNAESLEKAIKEVFLATYSPRARSWWSRVYENPEDVRSGVLLVKTVQSTHSSVALVSSDGSRFTIDSLPGIGENVVGGNGGNTAERLAVEMRRGAVASVATVQPAQTMRLKQWVQGEQGQRKIETVPRLYQGAVLSPEQRLQATRLIALVRAVASRDGSFRGKPLDLEIAWVGNTPHLVQIRVAPQEPGRLVLPGPPKPAKKESPKEKALPAKPAVIAPTPMAIAKGLIDELKREGRPVSVSTRLKALQVARASTEQVSQTVREEIVKSAQAAAVRIFAKTARGEIHYREARAIFSTLSDVSWSIIPKAPDQSRDRTPLFTHESSYGRDAIAALAEAVESGRHGPAGVIQLLEMLTGFFAVGNLTDYGDGRLEWIRGLSDLLSDGAIEKFVQISDDQAVANNFGGHWFRAFAMMVVTKTISRIIGVDDTGAEEALLRLRQMTAGTIWVADEAGNNSGSVGRFLFRRNLAAFRYARIEERYSSFRSRVFSRLGMTGPSIVSLDEIIGLIQTKTVGQLRLLVDVRGLFLDHLLDEEAKKPAAGRSLESLAAAFVREFDDEGGTARMRRAAELINETGAALRVVTESNDSNASTFLEGNGQRVLLGLGGINVVPYYALYLANVSVSADSPFGPSYNDFEFHRSGRGLYLPAPEEVANSPGKLAALLIFLNLDASRDEQKLTEDIRDLLIKAIGLRRKSGAPIDLIDWRAIFYLGILRGIPSEISAQLLGLLFATAPAELRGATVEITHKPHGKKELRISSGPTIIFSIELGGMDNDFQKIGINVPGLSVLNLGEMNSSIHDMRAYPKSIRVLDQLLGGKIARLLQRDQETVNADRTFFESMMRVIDGK